MISLIGCFFLIYQWRKKNDYLLHTHRISMNGILNSDHCFLLISIPVDLIKTIEIRKSFSVISSAFLVQPLT